MDRRGFLAAAVALPLAKLLEPRRAYSFLRERLPSGWSRTASGLLVSCGADAWDTAHYGDLMNEKVIVSAGRMEGVVTNSNPGVLAVVSGCWFVVPGRCTPLIELGSRGDA